MADKMMMAKTDGAPNLAWPVAMPMLVFALAWILFWHWNTAAAMVAIWFRSETFTHAILVPPIALWLIWRRRMVLATLPPVPTPLLLVAMALAGLGWLLGELAAVNAVTFLALISLLVLAVPTLMGIRVTSAILFPLAYLFFAVPIGEFALPKMMEWTAEFTVVALRLSGIPVYREGLSFVIPSGNWSVVEACSGVRYLIASVVVGTLYAYLNYRSLKRRLLFIAVSLVVPIVANWLRAYMIVMLGHLSGNRLAVGVDHLIYGWVFFGVVILLMFVVGARWAEPADVDVRDSVAVPSTPTTDRLSLMRMLVTTSGVALVVVVPVIWNAAIGHHAAEDHPQVRLLPPSGWQSVDQPSIDWRPAFANPDSEWRGELGIDQKTLGVFIAYYRNQSQDRKLITSTNALVKSSDKRWFLVRSTTREIEFGGQPVNVRVAELRGPAEVRLIALKWYWINGRLTGSDYTAKVWMAWSRLTGQGDDSAVVVVYVPKGEAGAGESTLVDLASTIQPAIAAALSRVRDGAVPELR